ncbi:molybdate transport system substrate-binding protein [Bradyrhizobium sp. USDA 3397]
MPDRIFSCYAAFLVIACTTFSAPLLATELKVIAPNAVKEAVAELSARFEKKARVTLVLSWAGSEAIAKRVLEDEIFDVVISTSPGLDRLTKEGRLVAASKQDFSRSAIGAAVKADVARPDVSTTKGLREALLKAESIGISSGASGRYLEQLFQKLGIADEIKHKIKQPPSGAQIGDLVARGDIELGFQQVTELVHAKGLQYLGPLPAEVQGFTIWSAAVHTGSKEPDAAAAFVKALSAPEAAAAIRSSGMEPLP